MKVRSYIASSDERFVFTSFCLQTGVLATELHDLLHASAKLMVALAPHEKRADGSDLLYGWAGRVGDELVYAYVKHDVRKFPVIPRLMEALGFDTKKPLVVRFNSLAMRTVVAAFRWPATFKESSHVRREETGPEAA